MDETKTIIWGKNRTETTDNEQGTFPLLLGRPGSYKSSGQRKEITKCLAQGEQVVVIQPEKEYEDLKTRLLQEI